LFEKNQSLKIRILSKLKFPDGLPKNLEFSKNTEILPVVTWDEKRRYCEERIAKDDEIFVQK